jgi:hypothetical protein
MNCASSLLLLLTLAFTFEAQAVEDLHTRSFKVPPAFLLNDIPGRDSPADLVDPFAAPATPAPGTADQVKIPRHSAREILEAQGITFPKEATAAFNPLTGLLNVTNTQPNLDLIETFIGSGCNLKPATIAFNVTVIEGPGELIRQANADASKTANAARQLAMLLDLAKKTVSNVRAVGDAFLETKSGTRATTEAVCEHRYASDFTMDAKSRAAVAHETRPLGLRLELEPTVRADGQTIELTLNLELNSMRTEERQINVSEPITGNPSEFSVTDISKAHFTTSLFVQTGTTQLIGIAKPAGSRKGTKDILWAAFITSTIRRLEAPPHVLAQDASPKSSPPKGMTAVTFQAPAGLFESIMSPMTKPLRAWLMAQGVTFPKGSSFEYNKDLLQVTNTPENIETISALIDHAVSKATKTTAFTLHTVQAPAAFLRELAHAAAASSDQSAPWAAVEVAIARGEATFIDSTFLETMSGTRATNSAACEHVYLADFSTSANGLPKLAFEMRKVGCSFEIEPTIGADGRTVDIDFLHELPSAAPEIHREHFIDPASKQRFDMPVTDFHSLKTTTSIAMSPGSTKLIALQHPSGRGDADVLWATFLKYDVVAQVAKSRQAMAEPAPARKPSADPKAIHTRAFRVPVDFLSAAGDSTSAKGAIVRKTAKVILEEAGIPFPAGTAAFYGPATTQMVVRNTNENLDLIETYADSIIDCSQLTTITFTTHILQGPGALLRRLTAQAASKSDHRAELDELLAAVKAGTVQHLDTARIETKSGTHATSKQGLEHSAINNVRVNDKGEPVFAQERRNVGLNVELEATVGADGVTVELTTLVEFHPAEPVEHREFVIDTQGRRLEFPLTDFQVAKLTTGITLHDGVARLLSLYKPTGKPEFEKEDVLQAIFITCDVLRVGE